MSLFNNAITGASGNQGYTIAKSVRLRSSASAYFNRTFTTPTDGKKWTYSFWIKRGSLTTNQPVLTAYTDANNQATLYHTTGNKLYWLSTTGGSTYTQFRTDALYRDPSAWYHFVVVFDSTNATSTDRIKMYVNGTSLTCEAGQYIAPALNTTAFVNTAIGHRIGNDQNLGIYFDGYLTEINFIDGQALTPSSFGETDSITGVWKAKKYSGTYGTNGFYLNFSDNSSNTATTIGKDYSGNGNNWTPNNISVTAGSTYDSMQDVPTLTSATAANYCVLNPLNKSSSSTVSNGNLRQTSSGGWYRAYSTIFFASTAVFYAEATMTALNSGANGVRVGIANANSVFTYLGSDANSWSYDNQGNKYNNGTLASYGASYVQGDVIGILFNNGSLTFYKNGASQGVAYSGLTGTFCFAGSPFDTDIVDWNFGQRPFSNLPSGALALNTWNLPDSTIKNGAGYMAATLYAGSSSAQSITNTVNGVSFQPDLVWGKNRSNINSHRLTDSVRGVGKVLFSNDTAGDTTGDGQLSSFNSNGWTFTSGVGAGLNESGNNYVAWQWKAGGTSSSNTNGSITSTVSAGATQGFSVVTYTGTGANATVGHGLGVAPSMVIVKSRTNGTTSWAVYHSNLTSASYYLFLDSTNAQASNATVWNSTAPTSTVFSIGTATPVNQSSNTFVAYCFAAVAGYSAFGSYTGNASTDGPFIYTGFRPRFIFGKDSGGTNNWWIFDSARDTYNVAGKILRPNLSDAELDSPPRVDLLSNGFKIRTVNLPNDATTYIYAAFAENPFKYSLAR